jgi:hypothetical protein
MRLAGLDIATTTGAGLILGEDIRALSFRPREKRPFGLKPGEVDFAYEGRLAREFRDWLRPLLVAEEIETVGIEKPLPPNVTYRKPIVDRSTEWAGTAIRYEEKGGTTMATIFRIYSFVSEALEICARLNIPVHVVSQDAWRKSFLGFSKAPKGTTDGSAWLKAQAKAQCARIGVEVKNADAADAVGVAWHLRGMMDPLRQGLFAAAE